MSKKLAGVLIAAEGGKRVRSSMKDLVRLIDDLVLALVARGIDELRLHHLRLVEIIEEMCVQGAVEGQAGQPRGVAKTFELEGGPVVRRPVRSPLDEMARPRLRSRIVGEELSGHRRGVSDQRKPLREPILDLVGLVAGDEQTLGRQCVREGRGVVRWSLHIRMHLDDGGPLPTAPNSQSVQPELIAGVQPCRLPDLALDSCPDVGREEERLEKGQDAIGVGA